MDYSIYLGRMPIMDGEGKIFAYELLHRSTEANYTTVDDNLQATARVLVNALNYIGLNTLTKHKPAFIKVDDKVLSDTLIFCISSNDFVLEILESSVITPTLVKTIEELHAQGYIFALNHFKLDDDFLVHFKAVLPFITYIKIDIRNNARAQIVPIIEQFKHLNIQLIAEKTEDLEDFEWAKEMGFKYFEGYYFSKPQVYVHEMIDPENKMLLELIYLLKKSASFEEILSIINNSPFLSISLLKFIHFHHGDHSEKILSIDQALILFGREKLSHWVELMIYAQGDDDYEDDNITSPLGQLARSRASLMEELSLQLPHKQESSLSTSAYLVGLLSLAEAIFQSSFINLFEQMDLDSSISNALINKEGILGQLLELCLCVERNDFNDITRLLSKLNLSQAQLNASMMKSYKRTSEK